MSDNDIEDNIKKEYPINTKSTKWEENELKIKEAIINTTKERLELGTIRIGLIYNVKAPIVKKTLLE